MKKFVALFEMYLKFCQKVNWLINNNIGLVSLT